MTAKILLINESAEECINIIKILDDFEVLIANNALEAKKKFETNEGIELILLDLALPNNDAFRILTEIKQNGLNRKIRIVILTQNDQIGEEAKALRCGAGDYVRKPFSPEGLRARLHVQLEILRQQKHEDFEVEERDSIFKMIFEQAPIGIVVSRSTKTIAQASDFTSDVNPMYEKITGRTQKEINEIGWPSYTHPEDCAVGLEKMQLLQEGKIDGYELEKRYIRPDGSLIWANVSISAIKLNGKENSEHVCLVQDITERKAAEAALAESERNKAVLLSHLPGMAYRCQCDREWTMAFVSEGCYELTGYRPESLLNNRDLSFNDLILPKYRETLWQQWQKILAQKHSFYYEYEIFAANGQRKWVMEMGQGVYNDSGNVEALEGIIIDITERKKYELDLAYTSGHDMSTGLYNYCSLQNFMESDKLKEEQLKRALILLKINKMSAINSTYGYSFTEKVFKEIADNLSVFISESRLLFRIFGDTLIFYNSDYGNRQELVNFCKLVIATINKTQIMKVMGWGIGVAELDKYDCDTNTAIINASEAAKLANENSSLFGYYFVDDKLIEAMKRAAEIQNNLIAIVNGTDNSEIFLEYQPILSIRDKRITAFEALARMQSEKLGRIAPLEFIPSAEKMQLIVPIGLKIMHKACNFLRRLQFSGYKEITVSVNISAIQFFRAEFVDDIIEIINKTQIDASKLCIEITESIFLGNYDDINAKLTILRKMGIKVAIDDFGVGYSSLAREGELNIDYLKIDKAFVDKLLSVPHDKAIAGDIIAIAHRRGHRVVAEGVEYELQLQYLVKHHCDYIQGYYFSRPLAEEDAVAFLTKNSGVSY